MLDVIILGSFDSMRSRYSLECALLLVLIVTPPSAHADAIIPANWADQALSSLVKYAKTSVSNWLNEQLAESSHGDPTPQRALANTRQRMLEARLQGIKKSFFRWRNTFASATINNVREVSAYSEFMRDTLDKHVVQEELAVVAAREIASWSTGRAAERKQKLVELLDFIQHSSPASSKTSDSNDPAAGAQPEDPLPKTVSSRAWELFSAWMWNESGPLDVFALLKPLELELRSRQHLLRVYQDQVILLERSLVTCFSSSASSMRLKPVPQYALHLGIGCGHKDETSERSKASMEGMLVMLNNSIQEASTMVNLLEQLVEAVHKWIKKKTTDDGESNHSLLLKL